MIIQFATLLRHALFALTVLLAAMPVVAQETPSSPVVAIDQTRGADDRVVYADLTKYGPWDDRNYDLIAEDLALLPAKDQYLRRVPAFFKVLKRKEFIEEGTPLGNYYPREIHFEFYYRYGGLMQNGEIELTSLGQYYYPDPQHPRFPPGTRDATVPMAAPIEGEGPLAIGSNETAIAPNPVNPQIVIAGSNGGGGQNQNFSMDGGQTWVTGGVLPQTCCDPAMEWSVDGTVAYAATLGAGAPGTGWRATVFRSTDNGMTWGERVDVSSGSSDKEYIHVDRSPTSPFNDNVYLTWHQGNVMFFSRSEDQASTWSTPVSFPQHPRGIGSDITTDADGTIYYFYPSVQSPNEILLLKSDDAGVTWSDAITVAALRGDFDFAIPSMETRRAFIYVSADVDMVNGRIYVSWTDKTPDSPAGSGGSANANVAWVRVAHSDDEGETWVLATTPHEAPLPPGNKAVDRYNQWMDVDPTGVIHLGFYDTRHTVDRRGVDFYYVASTDGGDTWTEETRVSAASSVNITNGQEWGDYNGLAFNPGNNSILMTWTDNRVVGASPQQRSFAGTATNVLGEPGFLLAIEGENTFAVCAGDAVASTSLDVTSIQDFVEPVTLALPGLDPTVFAGGAFSPNPVVPAQPAATSLLSGLTTLADAQAGTYTVTIQGEAGTQIRSAELRVDVVADTVSAPTLSTPADDATGLVPDSIPFTWQASDGAVAYEIEIATDAGFTDLVDTDIVDGNSYATDVVLEDATEYFWRVRATNVCGEGDWSAVFSFITRDDDTIFANGFENDEPAECKPLQLLADPSFETTDGDSGPNPSWVGEDSNGDGTPFWTAGSTTLSAAHEGDFVVWGGGWGSASTQNWSQSVTIPSGSPRFLNFWRQIEALPGSTGTLTASIDGTAVSTLDVVANGVDGDWVSVSVDVSAHADGAAHAIEFEYAGTGATDGNVYVDSITLECEAPAAAVVGSTPRPAAITAPNARKHN